jgi:hypothetical protein
MSRKTPTALLRLQPPPVQQKEALVCQPSVPNEWALEKYQKAVTNRMEYEYISYICYE